MRRPNLGKMRWQVYLRLLAQHPVDRQIETAEALLTPPLGPVSQFREARLALQRAYR